jgi:VWFA-related protein
MRLTLALLPFAVLLLPAQEPTIRVPVQLVNLNTLVFSKDNRLIPDLHAPDFQLTDNGHPQSLTVEETAAPLSLVLAIQANQDVRTYATFIAKSGSAVDALLSGATGQTAILTYADDIAVLKPFDAADDAQTALRKLSAAGKHSRMFDAGVRAISLLAARPRSRVRALVFIGQPADVGSETDIATLRRYAETENVAIYALTLPMFGKTFVSDTFSLRGPTFAERGGFRADTDFGKLISVLNRGSAAAAAGDPFSLLTAATGGTQLHVRTQREFEDAIAAVGVQLRSAYVLTYYPRPADSGYHIITVEVGIPGAKAFARPGYWLPPN